MGSIILSEINNYASAFHHDTDPTFVPAIVVAELTGFVKRALAVVYGGGHLKHLDKGS
jgi:hypothetical protein